MIYVFLADGFEEIEALTPVDILRRAELDVKLVGVTGEIVTGSHGISVKTDITCAQVTTDDMDMVVLPGGMPGTLNLEKDPIVKASASYCAKNNKLLGAICAAPSILGHMGILNGKKATCFPGFEDQLIGAEFTGASVEVDENIITAKGAGVSTEFSLKLVELVSSKKIADKIFAAIQCRA